MADNVVQLNTKPKEAKQRIDVKTEKELFAILRAHKLRRVSGEIGMASGDGWPGWLPGGGMLPCLWAFDIDEEQFDLQDDDEWEKLGFDREDDLDIDMFMMDRVYTCLSNRYEARKTKWRAQGVVYYDVEEETVTLDFLIWLTKTKRE